MNILIDSSKRFLKRIILSDNNQHEMMSIEGDQDILVLIDQVLKKGETSLSSLTVVKAKLEGESRVGVGIGVSAANALNYALDLKKVGELEFPVDDKDPFR